MYFRWKVFFEKKISILAFLSKLLCFRLYFVVYTVSNLFKCKFFVGLHGDKTYNTMVNSVSFVSTGPFNHVFPSLPMHTLCLLNFPGKFSWKQRISLSSNFPLHTWWGKFRRQKRTSSKIIGTTMDSIWRHRPVHIRTITLQAFIP